MTGIVNSATALIKWRDALFALHVRNPAQSTTSGLKHENSLWERGEGKPMWRSGRFCVLRVGEADQVGDWEDVKSAVLFADLPLIILSGEVARQTQESGR
jgi:hypothetical protein